VRPRPAVAQQAIRAKDAMVAAMAI